MEGLVLLIIFGGIGLATAHFLGRKRQIGFGWSLFFCLALSPIIGFIVTMLSRKYYDDNPSPSSTKTVIGWILIVINTLRGLISLFAFMRVPERTDQLTVVFMCIGLVGLGYYLIQLGKGKNFNSEALMKTDD